MESIAFKPFKCPLNRPNMGEMPHGMQIGVAERILLGILPSRLPLAQNLQDPMCTVLFEKASHIFFLQVAYRLL